MNNLFWIGLIFLTATEPAPWSSDGVVMFASPGDHVTVPCAISLGTQCSSISWTKGDLYGSLSHVVKAGRVSSPNITLLSDCSLHINYMVNSDASTYTCDNGKMNSSVDLQMLQITENPKAPKDKIELQCYLNDYKGLITCKIPGIQIAWLAADNTTIKGERFHFDNVSKCFSKLFIQRKLTDHFRKWKCQISMFGSAKATATYITTVTDGIEEVFAAVGESVSFTCTNTSSLALTGRDQTPTFIINTGSTSVIRHVSRMHSGNYQCLYKEKHKRIRLHTVDITSELDTKGNNVMLTCVLTCANGFCEKDFNLTWSEDDAQSVLTNENGTIINTIHIPVVPLSPVESVCSVHREGARVAAKKWRHYGNSLNGLAWIALPLGLLCIAAAGAVYVYKKRKHYKDSEHLQADIGMTHVYENAQDTGLQCNGEVVTSNDSFYDLLQAVN